MAIMNKNIRVEMIKGQTSIMSKLTLTRGVSITSARKSHVNVRANVSTEVATSHSEIVDVKYTPRTVWN